MINILISKSCQTAKLTIIQNIVWVIAGIGLILTFIIPKGKVYGLILYITMVIWAIGLSMELLKYIYKKIKSSR